MQSVLISFMRHRKIPGEYFYFMMNKKAGEVCSTVSDSHRTVYEHFEEKQLVSGGVKLHSVGRLDADTEGLLLFTNDGKLSDYLTRPENRIEKTYFVQLASSVSFEEQKNYRDAAEKGLLLPPEKKAPQQQSAGAVIKWLNEKECEIILTEGKFHEVKRIFRALGNEVVYLKRIKFAGIIIDEKLSPGEWRELTPEEKQKLEIPSGLR